jgi:hypothetical protein
MLGELQHAHKRHLERLLVGGAKRADHIRETSASVDPSRFCWPAECGLVKRTTPFNVQKLLGNIRSPTKRRPPFA